MGRGLFPRFSGRITSLLPRVREGAQIVQRIGTRRTAVDFAGWKMLTLGTVRAGRHWGHDLRDHLGRRRLSFLRESEKRADHSYA